MEFTKTKTEKIEVEITFPHYRKTICHTYKVLNEKHAICVTEVTNWDSIGQCVSDQAFNDNTQECTEDFYNKQFTKISKKLSQ